MVISHCITIMVTAETVELQQLQLTGTSSRISQKLPSHHHEWFPWTFFRTVLFQCTSVQLLLHFILTCAISKHLFIGRFALIV